MPDAFNKVQQIVQSAAHGAEARNSKPARRYGKPAIARPAYRRRHANAIDVLVTVIFSVIAIVILLYAVPGLHL